MQTPNFTAVLADIRAMQADRDDHIADLKEQRRELQGCMKRALDRLMYAELDTDMRHWTQSERDELTSAESAFDDALAELNLFNATHAEELK